MSGSHHRLEEGLAGASQLVDLPAPSVGLEPADAVKVDDVVDAPHVGEHVAAAEDLVGLAPDR